MEDLGVTMEGGLSREFWHGKRVLLTGHTGFKGGWLSIWLHNLGADVTGIGLAANTNPSLFALAEVEDLCESHLCDIRDADKLTGLITSAKPEVVFHLAAQPLVRASYRNPLETYTTNVVGTAHILDALRGLDSVRVAVMVTTDKVYQNTGPHWLHREEDSLGGHDPYSASKAACEIVIASYRNAFLSSQGVAVASARAGNVIGGGDWSEDRLIPDAMRAWEAGRILEIRRPKAVRPWQHVLEPLAGYLTLARMLWDQPSLAGAFNFGPEATGTVSVREVIEFARAAYGAGAVQYGDGSEGPYEAGYLALEIAKARQLLGVKPRLSIVDAVNWTMEWYRAQRDGGNARTLCEREMAVYRLRS